MASDFWKGKITTAKPQAQWPADSDAGDASLANDNEHDNIMRGTGKLRHDRE